MDLVAHQTAASFLVRSPTEQNQRLLHLQIVMAPAQSVREFYDSVHFPGHYDLDGVNFHMTTIQNPYLEIIDRAISGKSSVLDIGCGSGFISNFFATKYTNIKFLGIDFSSAIDYAISYAKQHNLSNIDFVKEDFLDYKSRSKFDLVLCQGVLHHIPAFDLAVSRIKNLMADNAELCVGLYHPWGKILKKYVTPHYHDETLRLDQECNPFETAYSIPEVLEHFCELDLIEHYPPLKGIWSNIAALINSQNGGLITYRFANNNQ